MHSGHGRLRVCLCVCLSVCPSIAAFAHDSTDPDATFRNSRRCPLVVHCWAVLQSVHGFRCCDNIATYAKFQPVLVLAKCLLRWSRWSTIQSLKKKVLAVFLRGGGDIIKIGHTCHLHVYSFVRFIKPVFVNRYNAFGSLKLSKLWALFGQV